jgi:replication factor C subunit 3/5
MNNDFLPWVEKYRPHNIDEIISNNENINVLSTMLKNGSLPHLLFHGTSGTGKTSLILALARKLYGNNINLMVMKLDASDDRGINSVREEIKGFAERKNMFSSGVKLIILDEADSMTFDAQFALRKIIEKYSVSTRFCLICNYENKIIPAIRSRCANFRFEPIPINKTIVILEKICKNEKLEYTNKTLEIIGTLCNGDLRKSINLLQTISMKSKIITEDSCYESAGLPSRKSINLLFEYLIESKYDFAQTYSQLYNIIKLNGYSLGIILKEVTILLIKNSEIFSQKKFAQIYTDLSDLETKVSQSTFDDIYISTLISIFKKNNN